jgi:hypothetical protein
MRSILYSLSRKATLWVLGAGLFMALSGDSSSQDKKPSKEKKQNKEAREAVLRMADLVERKDFMALKQQADGVAKSIEGLDDVMNLLKLRSRGGLGIGDTPGAVAPDGMEAKVVNMAKRPLAPAQLAKESKDLVRLAYVNAAIAQISEARTDVDGKMDPKAWQKWSIDMRQSAIELADAAQAMDPARVKAAAKKMNTSCTDCHDKFR